MQGSTRLVRLLILASAWLGLGCATSVDVGFDERQDFSPYRTWNWLPGAERRVEAPLGDPPALEARLARRVERALSTRGFERSEQDPDLLVSAYLGIQRQLLYVNETGATQSVHSLHSSPSYEIQATRQEIHSYESGYVVIAFTDSRQRTLIWRGEFRGRVRGDFWPHLDRAVSTLLERFPPK